MADGDGEGWKRELAWREPSLEGCLILVVQLTRYVTYHIFASREREGFLSKVCASELQSKRFGASDIICSYSECLQTLVDDRRRSASKGWEGLHIQTFICKVPLKFIV